MRLEMYMDRPTRQAKNHLRGSGRGKVQPGAERREARGCWGPGSPLPGAGAFSGDEGCGCTPPRTGCTYGRCASVRLRPSGRARGRRATESVRGCLRCTKRAHAARSASACTPGRCLTRLRARSRTTATAARERVGPAGGTKAACRAWGPLRPLPGVSGGFRDGRLSGGE